jgi:hypothetical protein
MAVHKPVVKAGIYFITFLRGTVGGMQESYDHEYNSVAFYELGQKNNPIMRDNHVFMGVLLEWKGSGKERIDESRRRV